MIRLFPIWLAAALFLGACGSRENGSPPAPSPPSPTATVPTAPEPTPYSPVADEIVRMVHAGLPENNIRNQILLRATAFNLSPDELIRMNRDGVPDSLISIIQQHDAQLAARSRMEARARSDQQLRRELEAQIAALRRERQSLGQATNTPIQNIQVTIAPPPSNPERVIERTIIREQVPVYVGRTVGFQRPSVTVVPRTSPVRNNTPFRPPNQGSSGFAAPVSGFAAPVQGFNPAPGGLATPVSGGAPTTLTNGVAAPGWRYYTGPGGRSN